SVPAAPANRHASSHKDPRPCRRAATCHRRCLLRIGRPTYEFFGPIVRRLLLWLCSRLRGTSLFHGQRSGLNYRTLSGWPKVWLTWPVVGHFERSGSVTKHSAAD